MYRIDFYNATLVGGNSIGILLQRIQKQGFDKKQHLLILIIFIKYGCLIKATSVSNSVPKSVELHLHCSFVCRYCDVTKAFGKEEQHVKVVSSNNSSEINKKEQEGAALTTWD